MTETSRRVMRGDYVRVLQTKEMTKLGIANRVATVILAGEAECGLIIEGTSHVVPRSCLSWVPVRLGRYCVNNGGHYQVKPD